MYRGGFSFLRQQLVSPFDLWFSQHIFIKYLLPVSMAIQFNLLLCVLVSRVFNASH